MPEDARNRFDDDVFTWQVTKNGKLLISWEGRVVTTLAGREAQKLIDKLDQSNRREIQHLLARATGKFKHGNERRD